MSLVSGDRVLSGAVPSSRYSPAGNVRMLSRVITQFITLRTTTHHLGLHPPMRRRRNRAVRLSRLGDVNQFEDRPDVMGLVQNEELRPLDDVQPSAFFVDADPVQFLLAQPGDYREYMSPVFV